MSQSDTRPRNGLLRAAVLIALVGLCCLGFFLWNGLSVLSMGIGVMLGVPLTLLAIGVYLVAVIRDLRHRGVL